jgi:hypothetical protein
VLNVKTDKSKENDVKSSLDRLRNHRQSYDRFSKNLEQRFLKTGDVIESFMINSGEIVRNSDKLYHLAIGSERGSSIDKGMEIVLELLDYINDYAGNIRKLITQAEQCHEFLLPVLEHETKLVRVFKPLKFARALFLLESANLTDDRKDIFVHLANEIAQMHEKVANLSSNEFSKFYDVSVSINRISSQLKLEIDKQLRVVENKRNSIEIYVKDLKSDLEINRNVNVALKNVSSKISLDVQDIITVIQNEDIARQKLRHVVEASDSLIEKLNNWLAGKKDDSTASILADVIIKSKVQIAQLESIIGDFRKTQTIITERSKTLESKVVLLDRECLALREFRVLTTSAGGIVESLILTLQETLKMVKAGTGEAEKAYQEIKPFSGISSNITTTLKQLSNTLRLIVLNAQLKATQVGKGTGLEVLASSVCTISDEAQGISVQIAGKLGSTATDISNLVESFSQLSKKGHEEENEYREQISQTELDLHGYRNGAIKIMLELGDQADSIARHASMLDADFKKDVTTVKYFEDFIQVFKGVIAAAETIIGDDIKSYLEESGEAPKYTMQEEWDIYQKVVAGKNTPIASAAVSNNTVDFFDEAPTAVVGNAASGESKKKDFGDNVDLF